MYKFDRTGMSSQMREFEKLNFGTGQPTSVPMEEVEVAMSVGDLVANFANAFVQEASRVNYHRARQVGLTAEEVTAYCNYLLTKRIEVVNNTCSDFRSLKVLVMPAFIQYCLAMVGRVVKRDFGLTIVPVAASPSNLTFNEALTISRKIEMFIDDLRIVVDAMPRSVFGDEDVMSTALIAGYVRSMKKVDHVASTYVAAFMGFQLKRETAFGALYRVQYDDLEYITQAMMYQKGLY